AETRAARRLLSIPGLDGQTASPRSKEQIAQKVEFFPKWLGAKKLFETQRPPRCSDLAKDERFGFDATAKNPAAKANKEKSPRPASTSKLRRIRERLIRNDSARGAPRNE